MLLLFVMCLSLCGCRRVNETYADELTTRSWYTLNPSGVGASLNFSENTATFIIYDKGKVSAVISGMYAADDNYFYITSDEYCKTYSFAYKVYANRAEINYNGESLVFYPEILASFDEIRGE